MRMRAKKWVKPELEICPYYIQNPLPLRWQWRSLFPKEQPFHVELGCGKGFATAKMARETPEVNFLAVDLCSTVLGVARRNIAAQYGEDPVDNIRLTHFNIMWASRFLAAEDRVDRIYIQFCNPWNQKASQHKRRLTHPRQLMQYREFLTEDAEIWFKTDDDPLFAASQEYFAACGFQEKYVTLDLHASGFSPNFVSEHEKLYADQGVPIKFGVYQKKPLPADFVLPE